MSAMVRIFSFSERWNVPFNSAVASLNGTFHLSPHENILTIALINIHYLYTILGGRESSHDTTRNKREILDRCLSAQRNVFQKLINNS